MTLLAIIASALIASLITAGAAYLIHRQEADRIIAARSELATQWALLAEVWIRIDPNTRPKVYTHLSWAQRMTFFSELAQAERSKADAAQD